MSQKKKKGKPTGKPGSIRFVTEYVNRWGKRMRARDYGYKAWPFRVK